jgi:hypothetical protein
MKPTQSAIERAKQQIVDRIGESAFEECARRAEEAPFELMQSMAFADQIVCDDPAKAMQVAFQGVVAATFERAILWERARVAKIKEGGLS